MLERCPSWRRARSTNERRGNNRVEVAGILERTLAGERLSDADALTLLRIARADSAWERRRTRSGIEKRPRPRHLRRRPQRQLHQHLHGALRVLRLLARPRRSGARATCCRSRSSSRRSRRRSRWAAPASCCRAGTTPISTSPTTTTSSARSRRATRSTCTRSRPPRCCTSRRRSKLKVPETIRRLHEAGLDSIPGGGAEILVDRVRRSLSPRKAKTDEWLSVMREAQLPGSLDHGHDDVRPRRDAGRAGRAPAPHPRAAGRDRGLPRLHLLDLPARRQPPPGQGAGGDAPDRRSTTCSPRPSAASTSTTSRTSRPAGSPRGSRSGSSRSPSAPTTSARR